MTRSRRSHPQPCVVPFQCACTMNAPRGWQSLVICSDPCDGGFALENDLFASPKGICRLHHGNEQRPSTRRETLDATEEESLRAWNRFSFPFALIAARCAKVTWLLKTLTAWLQSPLSRSGSWCLSGVSHTQPNAHATRWDGLAAATSPDQSTNKVSSSAKKLQAQPHRRRAATMRWRHRLIHLCQIEAWTGRRAVTVAGWTSAGGY